MIRASVVASPVHPAQHAVAVAERVETGGDLGGFGAGALRVVQEGDVEGAGDGGLLDNAQAAGLAGQGFHRAARDAGLSDQPLELVADDQHAVGRRAEGDVVDALRRAGSPQAPCRPSDTARPLPRLIR